MAITVDSRVYIEFIKKAATKIASEKEYVTELDSVTGDGDHWANINMGFTSLIEKIPAMEGKDISSVFKNIGMTMMSKIGGSSGILYGSAYMAAAKTCTGMQSLDAEGLYKAYKAMVDEMCARGNAKPGYKTMIDALWPAVETLRKDLDSGKDDDTILTDFQQAAKDGAMATKNMEAVKGRASYQTGKGVGHLDPGAVTMFYQIEALCNAIREAI